jgi:ribose 5-phosphate isomerase A
MSDEIYKQLAAEAALDLVESGMLLGLGHGSTVQFAIEGLAARLNSGTLTGIRAVPCSNHTQAEMLRLGIPLAELVAGNQLDLTIDGADEVDPHMNLIKGAGGAMLREKIVAQASKREVIIVTESKLSKTLGTKSALPIEVSPFAWKAQQAFLAAMATRVELRVDKKGDPVLSDQGNYLLDCSFKPISAPESLARTLEARAGIIEHGLFLGLATDVIVAGPDGTRHLT